MRPRHDEGAVLELCLSCAGHAIAFARRWLRPQVRNIFAGCARVSVGLSLVACLAQLVLSVGSFIRGCYHLPPRSNISRWSFRERACESVIISAATNRQQQQQQCLSNRLYMQHKAHCMLTNSLVYMVCHKKPLFCFFFTIHSNDDQFTQNFNSRSWRNTNSKYRQNIAVD